MWKVIIDISEIWPKFSHNFTEEFLQELVVKLQTYTEEIGKNFGEYAQEQYKTITDQLSYSDNDSNFDYNFSDLCEWVCDYDITIKLN